MIQLAISSRSRCHILDAEFNHDILSTNYEDRYSINAFPPQITFCQNRRYRYRYRVITGYFSSSRLFEREILKIRKNWPPRKRAVVVDNSINNSYIFRGRASLQIERCSNRFVSPINVVKTIDTSLRAWAKFTRGDGIFETRNYVYTILKILYEISIDFQEEGERKILKNGIFPRWIFSQLRMHTNREFHFEKFTQITEEINYPVSNTRIDKSRRMMIFSWRTFFWIYTKYVATWRVYNYRACNREKNRNETRRVLIG